MTETEDIFRGCNKYIDLLEKENGKLNNIIKQLEIKNFTLKSKVLLLTKRIKILTSPLKPLDECSSD